MDRPSAFDDSPHRGGARRALDVVTVVIKLVALVVGFALTLFSIMSLVGLVTDNLWWRLIPSAIVAVAAPLFAVERLLRDSSEPQAWPLVTDILALSWLGFGVLFVAAAFPLTEDLLAREATSLGQLGQRQLSLVASVAARQPPPPEVATNDLPSPPPPPPAAELDAGPADGDAPTAADSGAHRAELEADLPIFAEAGPASGDADQDGGAPVVERSGAELAHAVAPFVVGLVFDGNGGLRVGSGVVVEVRRRSVTVVTCASLVEGARRGAAFLGENQSTQVLVTGVDQDEGVATLRVRGLEVTSPAPFAPDGATSPVPLLLVGDPLAAGPSYEEAFATIPVGDAGPASAPLLSIARPPRAALRCGALFTRRAELFGLADESGRLSGVEQILAVHLGNMSELMDGGRALRLQPLVGEAGGEGF